MELRLEGLEILAVNSGLVTAAILAYLAERIRVKTDSVRQSICKQ